MNNELKNKLLKFKGTVSQQEVDFIKDLLPKKKLNLFGFKGSISNKESIFLNKMLPKRGVK